MRLPLAVCVLALCAYSLTACTDRPPDLDASTDGFPGAPTASTPVVMADGRESEASTSEEVAAEWTARSEIQAAIAAAHAYWAAQGPALEPDHRVLAVAEGAFTEPGAAEHAVLYLVTAWPRCCPKVGVAIVRDGRLLRNATFERSTNDARQVTDLDGDGRDELALWTSFGMGGDVEGSVSLASFSGDAPSGWTGAPVLASGCAAGRPDETAMRLTAVQAPTPTGLALSSEAFVRPCAGGEWAPTSEAEPLTLSPLPAEAFVVLPVE